MVAFEKFTRIGRSFKPEVTLRRSGIIGVNNGAIQRFALSRFQHVVLFYDRDTHRVGIQPVKNGDTPGAVTLRIKQGNASVSARSFLDCYEVPYANGPKYAAVWDDVEHMVVFDLKKPKE